MSTSGLFYYLEGFTDIDYIFFFSVSSHSLYTGNLLYGVLAFVLISNRTPDPASSTISNPSTAIGFSFYTSSCTLYSIIISEKVLGKKTFYAIKQ